MALVLTMAMLAACSDDRTRSATKPPDRKAEQLWSVALTPLMQPELIEGVAVLLTHTGPDLHVRAFDPRTGRQLWEDEATPSAVVPGIAVGITSVHDAAGHELVAYYSPERDPKARPDGKLNLLAHLLVREPKTGVIVRDFGPLYFREPAEECKGGRDVCAKAQDTPAATATFRRFDLGTGRSGLDSAAPDVPDGARELGTGLFDLGQRSPETLTRESDTGVRVWQVPLSEAFPSGTTSDHGWNVHLYDEEKVYVVLLGGPDRGDLIDLSLGSPLAGLDVDTGKVLWRQTGTSLDCYGRLHDDDDGRTIPVRCRYRGTASYEPTETLMAEDVVIEGFDISTGRRTWSVDAGAYTGAFPTKKAGPVLHLGAHQVLLPTAPEGPVVLDLRTGKTSPAPSTLVATCRKEAAFDFSQPYYIDGKPYYEHSAGDLVAFCDGSGRQTQALPTVSVLTAAGTEVDGTTLIASGTALTAYRTKG